MTSMSLRTLSVDGEEVLKKTILTPAMSHPVGGESCLAPARHSRSRLEAYSGICCLKSISLTSAEVQPLSPCVFST